MSRAPKRTPSCHPYKTYYARGMCEPCYNRWFRDTHPDYQRRHKAQHKEWLKLNPDYEKRRYQGRKQSGELRQSSFRRRLRDKYHLTIQQYREMLRRQDGRCAICGTLFAKGRPPHIDHDHALGYVRELLCALCNQGLGQFGDNVEVLQAAIKYLTKWNTEPVQLRLIKGSQDKDDTINTMSKKVGP